jgi:putative toxin-antitoxin system antitoxin component (TIGR02293 family)
MVDSNVDNDLGAEPTLAIVGTDGAMRNSIAHALKNDFKLLIVGEKGTDKSALVRHLIMAPVLIIYDLGRGIGELKNLRERYPETPMLVTCKKPDKTLKQAIDLGITDFITGNLDRNELRLRVGRCFHDRRSHDSGLGFAQEHTQNLVDVPLKELHSPSGRLNSAAIAKYLDVALSEVASALGVNYTALHKTPDSPSAQPRLATFKRILGILKDMLGPQATVRAWLNSPHPGLGNRTPISVMLEGHAEAVLTILENALAGVPI